MSDYGKLMSRIWCDREFTALDARPQQMYMLLLSYPTRNYAGVLPLTMRRWASATADATPQNIKTALVRLADTNFIVVDWDTEEVLVRSFIRNDEVYRQPNVMKSALKDVLKVASQVLRRALQCELLRLPEHKDLDHTHDVAKSLVETPGEPLAEGLTEGLSEGLGEGLTEGIGEGCVVSSYQSKYSPFTDHLSPSTQPPAGVSKGVQLVEDAKATKEQRACRLKDDWEPDPDVLRRVHAKYAAVDLREEFVKFQNHHIGKGTRWVDWNRAWWNWVAKAAQEQWRAQRNGASPSAVGEKIRGWQAYGEQLDIAIPHENPRKEIDQ